MVDSSTSFKTLATEVPRTTEQRKDRVLKIYYEDDALREPSNQQLQQLIGMATSTDTNSNNALLARKALRHRKVLERLRGVDTSSPQFDASLAMGVEWCRISNLKRSTAACRSRGL